MEEASSKSLLKHYEMLLGLYTELENISSEVVQAIESGKQAINLTLRLKQNMAVAERIREESRKIASMKKTLAEQNHLTEEDRNLIKQAENNLTQAVNRVVAQGNKSQEIMNKQGVKISRR